MDGGGFIQHQRFSSMLVCDYRNISIDGSVRCWPSNRNARLLTLIRRASSVVPQDVVVLRTTGCILLGVHIVEQSRAEQVPIPTYIHSIHLNGATSSNIPFNHVFSPSSVLFALVEVVLAFRVVATTTPSTVLLIWIHIIIRSWLAATAPTNSSLPHPRLKPMHELQVPELGSIVVAAGEFVCWAEVPRNTRPEEEEEVEAVEDGG